jgi:hypothetical protein
MHVWHCVRCDKSALAGRFVAYGAMVSGPNSIQGTTYTDSRDQTYQFSEPSLDYQVGLALPDTLELTPFSVRSADDTICGWTHRAASFLRLELWWTTILAWVRLMSAAWTSATPSLARQRRLQALWLRVGPPLWLSAALMLLHRQASLYWAMS